MNAPGDVTWNCPLGTGALVIIGERNGPVAAKIEHPAREETIKPAQRAFCLPLHPRVLVWLSCAGMKDMALGTWRRRQVDHGGDAGIVIILEFAKSHCQHV